MHNQKAYSLKKLYYFTIISVQYRPFDLGYSIPFTFGLKSNTRFFNLI